MIVCTEWVSLIPSRVAPQELYNPVPANYGTGFLYLKEETK